MQSASPSRTPSLDGLRALSIALVVLGHLGGTRGFPYVDLGIGDYAHLGVIVFFVISGFLITRLILTEHVKTGDVSLKLFYARRSLRVFPAAFAFIACITLLWRAGFIHLESKDFWHAVTYTVNFMPERSWYFGHLWSLSVEEQFYLLWPLTFVLLGRQRAHRAVIGVILFAPVARLAAALFLKQIPYSRDLEMFPMVADSLAVGCLLATTGDWLERQQWYRRLFHPAFSFGLLIFGLVTNRYLEHKVVAIFGISIINVIIAILVHRCVYCSQGWVGRILNWRPIALVGVLSYSLYLWQQPFLDRGSTAWVTSFPQNLALAAILALTSYFLLERPLLNLRRRLHNLATRPISDTTGEFSAAHGGLVG